MKKRLSLLLCALILTGCAANSGTGATGGAQVPETSDTVITYPDPVGTAYEEIPFVSRFGAETVITLTDEGITVTGNEEAVSISNDIIYYEDKDTYDSGNPYGEGTDADKHSAEEAAAHTVVNITQPGTYRVTGTLSAGQIRVDLGDNAYYDKNAVVELILEDADITCTVAPAVLFLNVYECDGEWSTDTAASAVDTSAAGANLVLEGENNISGSYVARIYKDKEGEKKLWKQDGALYSYMSMNVYGPGTLNLTAENEGLDSELHLTINGGNLNIRSGNDGINTNEDGVSVTTINAGQVHVIAGLGDEGDGIDSNGYLVINGGTVVASANPASDAGLDSDMGSYINGGMVVALGSTMDWAESESGQVTMNLQFADFQESSGSIVIAYEDGTAAFAYDPSQDEVLGENVRRYRGAIISSPNLHVGQGYEVYMGSTISGTEIGGIYDVTTVSGFTGGTRMMYTGTDVTMGFGGMGGFGGGQMSEGVFDGEKPEDDFTLPGGETMPGVDFTKPEGDFQLPEDGMPDGNDFGAMGGNRGDRSDRDEHGFTPPEGSTMPGDFGPGGMDGRGWREGMSGESRTLFYMQDMVNFFSGLTADTEG